MRTRTAALPVAFSFLVLVVLAAEPRPARAERTDPDSMMAATTEAVEADAPEDGAASMREPLPTLAGPIGLMRLSTAETGTPARLRLGLHGEYSRSSDLIIRDDRNTRLQGTLVLGYTPVRYLEVFGSLFWA